MPNPAAAPMAGAPRTVILRMLSATASTVVQADEFQLPGQGALVNHLDGVIVPFDGAHTVYPIGSVVRVKR